MEEVAALIVELLKTHNRVSLPGMGAFMASPQPAVIDKERKIIAPPSKKITFSKSETWNDGLLEHLYADRRGMDIEEARDRLRHIITDIRFELDAAGKATLPGLGTLKQTQARDISFGLNKNLNLQADSYGLNEVKMEPGAAAFKEKSKVKKTKNASASSSKGSLPMLILLGVMVVVISALALYLFLSHSGGGDDLISSSSVGRVEVPQQQQPVATPVSEPAQQEYIVHQPEKTPQQPAPAKSQPAKSQPSTSSSRCEYCVVATSLSTYEAAMHKASSYRKMGYKSEVINSGNSRYRVTLGCYRSNDLAKQELRNTQKFIKDAWILEVCK